MIAVKSMAFLCYPHILYYTHHRIGPTDLRIGYFFSCIVEEAQA